MKIRNGFVSNSSSSSFIAIGVKYPIDIMTPELESKIDDAGYSLLNDPEVGWYQPDSFLVGDSANVGDEEEGVAWTANGVQSIWDEVTKLVGEEGENIIITGVRMS